MREPVGHLKAREIEIRAKDAELRASSLRRMPLREPGERRLVDKPASARETRRNGRGKQRAGS
jgi:hypothetical protein